MLFGSERGKENEKKLLHRNIQCFCSTHNKIQKNTTQILSSKQQIDEEPKKIFFQTMYNTQIHSAICTTDRDVFRSTKDSIDCN